ncbi:hypothetical protein ABZ942_31640 [Nocardia sp. NPDC046473]|uniref:hypothetical protein n=1 Tax=Nocardia sp. NPDC046473 TaxID=3155733 RepID=UPI0033F9644D
MSNPFGGRQGATGPDGRQYQPQPYPPQVDPRGNPAYAGRPALIPPHVLLANPFQTTELPPYSMVELPEDFCIPWAGRNRAPMPRYTPEPGPTGIMVTASHLPMYFPVNFLAFTRPKIFINGQEVPDAGWGDTFVPLAPGIYRVRVYTAGLRWAQYVGLRRLGHDFGFTDAFLPVPHNHSTRTYYRSPIVAMLPGALDPQPQKSPGMTWFYIVATIAAVFVGFMLYAIISRFAGW